MNDMLMGPLKREKNHTTRNAHKSAGEREGNGHKVGGRRGGDILDKEKG